MPKSPAIALALALLTTLPALAATSSAARPRAAASQAAPTQPPAADLTTLAPKDAADKPVEPRESRDSTNRKGVNCHHYPARCR